MTKSEFEKLLRRYLQGECTEEEKWKIKIWFDQIETDYGYELSDEQKAQLEEILLSGIDDKIDKNKKAKTFKIRLNTVAVYGSIAASLILTIFLLRNNWIQFENLGFENKTVNKITKPIVRNACEVIILEDGTKVHLQSGSSITYGKHFEKLRRVVTLKGSGYFQVSKNPDRPFYVFCNGTITKVLGTSFWISSNDKSKSVEIGVKTGKVSVMVGPGEISKMDKDSPKGELFLTPNQRVVFFENDRKLKKTLVAEPAVLETAEVASLKFIYEDTPLVKVLQELGQGYNVEILVMNEKLKNCSFTGDLTLMTFQEKFDLICQSVNSQYNIQGTSVILTGPGCNDNL
ncbi:FecR family protein [Dyadobacter koreensis]|uniref:FecR family protein n=1 Tax=Dyadobacter koreensis TaxID=408657 RepID=A0A1H6URU4_9BACT|nr:FecR family protein [Dyadobacter koreensis]SEI94426.1 FecR family protein [Dyadobacter koreensis]